MVRQTQQSVTGNPLLCAMKCHPDKGALGVKKLEKFVPSKTGRMIDFRRIIYRRKDATEI